jgi:Putative prokaryotic signal transducing protein
MAKELRVKIVYQAENIIDANLVKNALENAGIPAFVGGQYLTGAIGELPPMGLVNVMVGETEWPQARAIAQSIDEELSQRRAAFDDGDLVFDPA